MKFIKYEGEIYDLLLLTQSKRFTDPEAVIAYAEKITAYAEKMKDIELLGFAYFCMGDAYYTLSDCDNCFTFINQAMQELNAAQSWEKLGECYNLLGLLFSHQGNMTSALDSYYEAIELIEIHQLDFIGAMVYENYSELCDRTDNKEEALQKVLISKEYVMRIPDHPRWRDLTTAILVTTIKSYMRLGDIIAARKQLDELNTLLKDYPEETAAFDVQLMNLLLAHAEKNEKMEVYYLDSAMEAFIKCVYRIDYFWSAVALLFYLEDKKNDMLLEAVIKLLESSLEGKEFPDLQFRIYKFKIALLQRKQRKDELLRALLEYCQYADCQKVLTNRSMYMLIALRNSLKQIKRTNDMLVEKAETDPLTGIANRRKLTDIMDQYFEEAYHKRVTLGIEMIDIDQFKQINDTYGHHIGDDCLIAVAEALKKVAVDSIRIARYGGDEFFMLYLDQENSQIGKVCEQLNENIRALLLSRQLPRFTISQGICNRIPDGLNKVWDFTSLADQALYAAKKNSGDKIVIIQHSNDL